MEKPLNVKILKCASLSQSDLILNGRLVGSKWAGKMLLIAFGQLEINPKQDQSSQQRLIAGNMTKLRSAPTKMTGVVMRRTF